ncbi:hypothetical protein BaRGS_00024437, partial [Batillaria attramentaria]
KRGNFDLTAKESLEPKKVFSFKIRSNSVKQRKGVKLCEKYEAYFTRPGEFPIAHIHCGHKQGRERSAGITCWNSGRRGSPNRITDFANAKTERKKKYRGEKFTGFFACPPRPVPRSMALSALDGDSRGERLR